MIIIKDQGLQVSYKNCYFTKKN